MRNPNTSAPTAGVTALQMRTGSDTGNTNWFNIEADRGNGYVNFNSGAAFGKYVFSNGNVGVGISSPGTKLDVNGGIATNRNYIYLAGAGDLNHAIGNIAGDGEEFRFHNFLDLHSPWGGGRLYITAAGNVGIGTTTPGSPLTVNGMIESKSGGIKFPDGTTQMTASSSGSGMFASLMSTKPTLESTGFATWVNQGTATISDTAAGVSMSDNTAQGADNLRLYCKNAPAAPYTITAFVVVSAKFVTNTSGGLAWRNTSNGKIVNFAAESSANVMVIKSSNWNSTSSWISSPAVNNLYSPSVWLRISDDGTNVSQFFSLDGVIWQSFFSVVKSSGWLGSTGYNQVCLCMSPWSSASVSLMSYQEN